MIEIEKKFVLRKGDKEKLIAGAKFVGEKRNTDTYYDTADYQLTTKDRWLRRRNGTFELKIGMPGNATTAEAVDRYQEIDNPDEIRKLLQLPAKDTLEVGLKSKGYLPFGTYTTHRSTYKKGEFKIDIDEADFGFRVTEIELEALNEEQIPGAVEKILTFAREHGLTFEALVGKAPEYIRRNNPAHYSALVEAGVV